MRPFRTSAIALSLLAWAAFAAPAGAAPSSDGEDGTVITFSRAPAPRDRARLACAGRTRTLDVSRRREPAGLESREEPITVKTRCRPLPRRLRDSELDPGERLRADGHPQTAGLTGRYLRLRDEALELPFLFAGREQWVLQRERRRRRRRAPAVGRVHAERRPRRPCSAASPRPHARTPPSTAARRLRSTISATGRPSCPSGHRGSVTSSTPTASPSRSSCSRRPRSTSTTPRSRSSPRARCRSSLLQPRRAPVRRERLPAQHLGGGAHDSRYGPTTGGTTTARPDRRSPLTCAPG